MNILLCYPLEDNETGIAIKEGFESNKHKVCAVDARSQANVLSHVCSEYGGDFDLLLCSRTHELYEPIVKIKKKYPNIKTAIWNTDIREPIADWGPINFLFSYVDYYFSAVEGQLDAWKEINPNSHFLPQGVHARRYFPMKPTHSMIEDWQCDVGFIGNLGTKQIHKDRIDVLTAIGESDMQFRHFTDIHGEIHNYAVACSKVNICNSAYPEVKNAYSVRNWKILGAGGIAIERHHEGIEEYFNGYIESYKTPEEAVSVCKHILENYEHYQKKAKKAVVWTRENHSYQHRIRSLLEITHGNDKT